MKNDIIEHFTKMNKSAAESVKALADINVKTVKALSEKQFEIFNAVLDAASKQFSLATEVKEPAKLIEAQTKLAKETTEKVTAIASTTQEIAESYKTELTGWVEKGLKTAQTAAKKAA